MSKRKPDEGLYSRVSRRVWKSRDFRTLSAPKPNAQTLWLRLLCGPELGQVPGLFETREAGLAEALGWPLAPFRRCLKEITDREMASFDKGAGLMWVPKAIHHNAPDNPNIVIGWKVAWKDLPDCKVKHDANLYLQRWCVERGDKWANAWCQMTSNVAGNVTPQPSPEQLWKQDQDEHENKDQDEHENENSAPPQRSQNRFLKSFETTVPDQIEITETHRELCRTRGLDVENEIGKHRSWALSRGRRCLDWPADFELWIRNSRPVPAGQRRSAAGSTPADQRIQAQMDRVARLEAEELAAAQGGQS